MLQSPSPVRPRIDNIVRAAASGDQRAWDQLVERYTGLLWSVARAHRLDAAEAADVVQTSWLRLVEHLDKIRTPAGVGAWLGDHGAQGVAACDQADGPLPAERSDGGARAP